MPANRLRRVLHKIYAGLHTLAQCPVWLRMIRIGMNEQGMVARRVTGGCQDALGLSGQRMNVAVNNKRLRHICSLPSAFC